MFTENGIPTQAPPKQAPTATASAFQGLISFSWAVVFLQKYC